MGHFEYAKIILSLVVVGIAGALVSLYKAVVARPRSLRAAMTEQGIRGPPPSFLLGNIMEIKKARAHNPAADVAIPLGESPAEHNCAKLLFPFFHKWTQQYGKVFVFSLGNTQILYVNRADVVREITTCTSLDLGKPLYQAKERGPLLGQGILTSNGTVWSHQRKVLAPELYMEKVKGMVNLITESANALVATWTTKVNADGGKSDVKIDSYMRSFSGDVISRACFGSNYSKGEEIFQKLRCLQEAMTKKIFFTGIPGIRYIPMKSNRKAWALEAEVAALILRVVKEKQAVGCEKNLLQKIIEGAHKSDLISQEAVDRFIVDNCKNIYLAGYETTAVSAMWCLMLLATNQEWQDRTRAEVLEVCQGCSPSYDHLLKMKQLTMVIYEALRLYPPGSVVTREAFNDMKFRDINVPKGINVWTMVAALHTDLEMWGPHAYEFKPERFENGIAGACKLPHLYMPFGVGPRVCLGQNLAMVELQILLSLILTNFSFSLSPNYRHLPSLNLVVEPKYGVDLLLTKL